MAEMLTQSRQAAYTMATLTTAQKNEALLAFAALLETHRNDLRLANDQDLKAQEGQLSPALFQRLKLSDAKINTLIQGLKDVAGLPDPVGRVTLQTKLDEGLVLSKVAVPIGVIGIVFESRPDVVPQILSLILKSGNAVVFKGGREAHHSNAAFMRVVDALNARCPFLPKAWGQLIDSRQAFQALLDFHDKVDLVIPRGSNQLVQQVMAATKIPVLGHADGICHLYVHASADAASPETMALIMDSKCQYPAACNALETLLVDAAVVQTLLPLLKAAADESGVILKGCSKTQAVIDGIEPAQEADWHTEYGDLTMSVKVVDDLAAAIAHINTYGSHHTDCIVARDEQAMEQFMAQVDSASVFANASTRFADGFRYGFGAEIGISTAKTHARGPVGMDGLVIYKYQLHGHGHLVADYSGDTPKPFLHQPL
ncbi:MAG: glutamate-5-semialdehyde dehydrogenase [Cyanobacteria bacterium HKST-UBA03]|nr:glutamate-5-semialdehyde dehydrogenase [Cyanobacteria bacterium HKST-UBA03]